MRWNSLLLPLALIGGLALAAALIGTTGGGRAGTAAEAHVVVDGPVECGSHVTIAVYLDSIDARTSDLGQRVGLGAYNVALHYPNDALRPADRDATRVVLPDSAPTVDGAALRQWIPGSPYSDLFTGELWFGAFSYAGSVNPSKSISEIDVVDGMEERERGGADVAKVAPLLLGTFDLVTGKPGTHVAELTLTAVDSSMAGLEYANDKIDIPIEVKDGPCAKFAEIEPPPTYPPTMPPFEGWDKIPTPDPYPDDITPTAGELADLGDACAGGAEYVTKYRGDRLCLPPGWSMTSDPSASDVATVTANNPGTVQQGHGVNIVIDRRGANGAITARIAVTVLAAEPYSITRCELPTNVPRLGSLCIHGRHDGRSMLPAGTWRMIGVNLAPSKWAVVQIFEDGDTAALAAIQREALEILISLEGA